MQAIQETRPEKVAEDLYVDIDGTLLRTDLLYEAAWEHIKLAPWRSIRLFFLLLTGRHRLKSYLARKVRLDPANLPYETRLLDYLKTERARGRSIILITASHRRYASQIARHVGLADAAYGSSNRINLKGRTKLAKIRELSLGRPFVYAGDARADRPIWKEAQRGIYVNASRDDSAKASQSGSAELVIQSRPSLFKAFLKSLRLHQWAKNALIFVPLLTSHSYTDAHRVTLALVAFLAFGLCASGHYLLNDLLDLPADRVHPRKCLRPLASGDLALPYGVAGAIAIPVLAFSLSILALPVAFTAALLVYFALTNLYSFYLKRVSTADVVTLALLYTIRVVAGATAITVVLSSWLLAFSVFMFVSLAYLKRYIEVTALGKGRKAAGRGYSDDDAETMFTLGIANTTAATVVFAFYISSAEIQTLYREPRVLWLLCLLMLYWSNRIWIGAKRGKINEDPVVFAIRDRVSRMVGILAILVILAARILP